MQAVNDRDLSYDYPDQPKDLCIEYEGLKCVQGYRCDVDGCGIYRGTPKSAKDHHQRDHKDIPLPGAWQSAYIQRWNSFNH